MVPMVATTADLLGVKATMASAADELKAAGVEIGSPKIGVMIEVPSAAVTARALARHADFFSIGTNDLTQYTLAADRMNGRLAGYSDAAHPAVLGLCKVTADAALEAGISVAVCGGAAGDPVTATLFAGMGMDKLSVAPPLVNRTKAVIDGLDPNAVAAALDGALAADSADEVRTLVGGLLGDGPR
jgi:phosphoenolpyruvate-protein kinase (PTS system EI component)